ncbi:hypothetical protein HDF10_004201 [Edaphobacter lichenicola]|uniref:Uncharacterized protein n=1 Tax=Tunturiibacter lichenicola TaxID=2051959 RepID=A0A7W8JDU2_9BACT|nr:hypothetical protein [Edaphobacter lichenicola]
MPRKSAEQGESASATRISRRSFLGMSASGSLAFALPRREQVEVVHRENEVHLLLNNVARWSVAGDEFGERARLFVHRGADATVVSLRDGELPGSGITADFDLAIGRGRMPDAEMRMANGLTVVGDAKAWLLRISPLQGRWDARSLAPGRAWQVVFQGRPARARLDADWGLDLEGVMDVSLAGLDTMRSERCSVSLLHACELLEEQKGNDATRWVFHRGDARWRVRLDGGSPAGASLDHEDEIFDELHVESVRTEQGSIHGALLRAHPARVTVATLRPANELITSSGERFTLPLTNLRMAMTMARADTERIVVSDEGSHEEWAHGREASYLIASVPGQPQLEWNLDTDEAAVGAAPMSVSVPVEDGCLTFHAEKRPHSFWHPAGWFAPLERLFGLFHTAIPLEYFSLPLERPDDMAIMRLTFQNLELRTWPSPKLCRVNKGVGKGKDAFITVILPGQDFAEEAFFRSSPENPKPSVGAQEMDQLPGKPTDPKAAQKEVDKDLGRIDDETERWPAEKFAAKETKFVYRIPDGMDHIPFTAASMMTWTAWELQVADVAKTDAEKNRPKIAQPDNVTQIEMPWKLILSPHEKAKWSSRAMLPKQDPTKPVELWSMRFYPEGDAGSAGTDAKHPPTIPLRAIWSDDYRPVDNPTCRADATQAWPPFPDPPVRMALSPSDRNQIVHLTSNWRMPRRATYCKSGSIDNFDTPRPFEAEHMLMTSMGGYLKGKGIWDPLKIDENHALTIEEWDHTSSLGHPSADVVSYAGFLMPFGLRATLIKETKREADNWAKPPGSNRVTAAEHQRYYVKVAKQEIAPGRFGVPYAGREMSWTVLANSFTTLPLNDAESIDQPGHAGTKQTWSLFWPMVMGKLVQFPVSLHDVASGSVTLGMPMAFVGVDVAQTSPAGGASVSAKTAVDFYNAGGPGIDTRDVVEFGGARLAFAPPLVGGDTDLLVQRVFFQAQLSNEAPHELYRENLPYFYPYIDWAEVRSSSVDRISAPVDATRVQIPAMYLDSGFDPKGNPGEVFVQAISSTELSFGRQGRVDQSGGLVSPDVLLAGFSRKAGPVGGRPAIGRQGRRPAIGGQGGTIEQFGAGRFDPVEFFGGLESAKILGGIKLSSVIAAIAPDVASNLEKAPKMLEEAAYEVGAAELRLADVITAFQADSHVLPIATLLSNEADAVAVAAIPVRNAVNSATAPGIAEGTRLATAILAYSNALGRLLSKPDQIGQEWIREFVERTLPLNALLAAASQQFDAVRAALLEQIKSVLPLGDALKLLKDNLADAVINVAIQVSESQPAQNVQRTLRQLAPEFVALLDLMPVATDLKAQVGALVDSATSVDQIPRNLERINAALSDVDQITMRLTGTQLAVSVPTMPKIMDKLQSAFVQVWIRVVDAAGVDAVEKAAELLCSGTAEEDARNLLQATRRLRKSVMVLVNAGRQWPSAPADPRSRLQMVVTLMEAQRDILAAMADIQGVANRYLSLGDSKDLLKAVDALSTAASVARSLANANDPLSEAFDAAVKAVLAQPEVQVFVAGKYADLITARTQLQGMWQSAQTNLAIQVQVYANAVDFVSVMNAPLEFLAYSPDLGKDANAFLNALAKVPAIDSTLSDKLKAPVKQIAAPWASLIAKVNTPIANNEGLEFARKSVIQMFGQAMQNVTTGFADVDTQKTLAETLHAMRELVAAVIALYDTVRKQIGSISNAAPVLIAAGRAKLNELLANPPFPTTYKVSFDWHPDLRAFEPVFLLRDGADMTITAQAVLKLALASIGSSAPPLSTSFEIEATLKDFSINLIGSPSFVILNVDSLTFKAKDGAKPDVRLLLDSVKFGEDMGFVKELAALLNPKSGPFIELIDGGVRAGYRFAVETQPVGCFILSGLRFEVAAALPFNGDPMRCIFQISSQQEPFLLSSGIYGGGGFLGLQLGLDGVELLEGALEFGLVGAMSVGPISGRGFIVAGIYFSIAKNDSKVCGFVHAHGYMDIFGFITLTLDVYVSVCYESKGGSVYGEANVSIHIKIAFFSKAFNFTTRQKFAGNGGGSAQRNLSPKMHNPSRIETNPHPEESQDEAQQPARNAAPLFPEKQEWDRYIAQFVD